MALLRLRAEQLRSPQNALKESSSSPEAPKSRGRGLNPAGAATAPPDDRGNNMTKPDHESRGTSNAIPRPKTHWPEELASIGAIRFARTYYQYDEAVHFFRDLVRLPLYEQFEGSYGENGSIFGLPNLGPHTRSRARNRADPGHGIRRALSVLPRSEGTAGRHVSPKRCRRQTVRVPPLLGRNRRRHLP